MAKTVDEWEKELANLTAQKPQAYKQSDAVTGLYNDYTGLKAAKPGDYVSKWQTQLDDIIGQINDKKKFTYDLNADPLYQQYKDQYVNLGKNAMMDTMANAASLTGGYGNSYASTAGNQAYQGYLNQLNQVVPELYQNAYGKYRDEIGDMYNKYNLYSNQDATDYGRYRDQVGDYNQNLDRAYNEYMDASQLDRSDYQQLVNDYNNWLNFNYNQYRDAVADDQWAKNFALQQAAAASKGSGGGGGGGSKSATTDLSNYRKYADNAVKAGKSNNDLATYFGDAFLNGQISGDDLDRLAAEYGVSSLVERYIASNGTYGNYGVANMAMVNKDNGSSGNTSRTLLNEREFAEHLQKNGTYKVNGVTYKNYADYATQTVRKDRGY